MICRMHCHKVRRMGLARDVSGGVSALPSLGALDYSEGRGGWCSCSGVVWWSCAGLDAVQVWREA
jgi:hypothetical protein